MESSNDIVELLMNGYLRVPTIILQMQPVLKNASAYACLQFIWAKTNWNQKPDTIAYSQFRDDKRYGTGLSIKTIQRSIEKLESLGVIIVKPSFNNMYEFSIDIEKVKELTGYEVQSNSPEAQSNSPDLKQSSQVNLTTSQVNLSAKPSQFVCEPSQNDLHVITSTQDSLRNKDIKEKNKKENPKNYKPEKPESVSEQVWLDLLSHRKSKKTSNTQTAWTMIFNQLEKAQQTTGHTLDQIITEWLSRDWKGFKSDWYINAQANQNTAQGNNHANNQSASTTNQGQRKKSSSEIYEEKLARSLAERFPDEFTVPF